MKTTLLLSSFLLGVSVMNAQTALKPSTVHITNTENINGIETVTDTMFTTKDAKTIHFDGGSIDLTLSEDGNTVTKVIVKDANGHTRNEDVQLTDGAHVNVMKTILMNDNDQDVSISNDLQKEIDTEIEKALQEAGVEAGEVIKKIIMLNDSGTNKHADGKTHSTKVIVTKKIEISHADQTDIKRLGQRAVDTDGKLNLDHMTFYPNPNTGRFHLNFTLQDQGDAEVTIMSLDGKSVYDEKLHGFSGNYDKEIDISKQAKGIYFVKVEQGQHAQIKKIVIE